MNNEEQLNSSLMFYFSAAAVSAVSFVLAIAAAGLAVQNSMDQIAAIFRALAVVSGVTGMLMGFDSFLDFMHSWMYATPGGKSEEVNQ